MGNPYRKISKDRRPVSAQAAQRTTGESRQASQQGQAPSRMAVRPRTQLTAKSQEALYEGDGTFNPQRYERAGSRSASTDRRMFDGRGEVNAWNRRDAMTQIHQLMNEVTKKNAADLSFYRPEAEQKVSKEARRDILAAALTDPTQQGFHIVGEELALPIKAILDYEGFARKIFRVRKLAQAELFRIPVDIRSTAWVVGQDGQTPESRIKTKWITPPEWKITSFPSIDIMDIYQMNFDVLDRAQDTARQEIELKEDKAAISIIDEAANTENAVTTFASLGIGAFEDVRFQVERHRLMVENFLINRAELSDIVKTMSTLVDPVTERELILAGYVGNILNAQILTAAGTGVEEVIPAGTFYATTGSDYMGEMGVRIELFSEPYNKYSHQETVKGWAFIEMVGFAIANSRSVAKGMK
jgi:hypothetical protein